jgi:hypothetical protein
MVKQLQPPYNISLVKKNWYSFMKTQRIATFMCLLRKVSVMNSISYILRPVYVSMNSEKFSNPLHPQHPSNFLVSDFICKEKRTKIATNLHDL